MQKLAVLLNTVCIGLSLALIYFPTAAVTAMTREAGEAFFQWTVIKYLAPHLLGPATTLIITLTLRVFIARHLRIPLWLAIVGALGALYSIAALRGGYAHDFSHYICDSCTGYGTLILTLAPVTTVLLLLTFVAQTRGLRTSQPDTITP